MSKALLRLAILSAPLLLTACGEGWEVHRTSDYGTYEMDRTAGTGVAYVRAKMLPEKEIVVEPMMEEISTEAKEPVMQADEIFSKALRKGATQEEAVEEPIVGEAAEGVEKVEEIKSELETEVEEIKSEADNESEEIKAEGVEEDKHSSYRDINIDKQASMIEPASSKDISAEEYIAQAPKRIMAPKVEVIKTETYTEDSSFMRTAVMDSVSDEAVEVYDNEVVQPKKQIIVPKKDNSAYPSVGEETLDEIYDVPF